MIRLRILLTSLASVVLAAASALSVERTPSIAPLSDDVWAGLFSQQDQKHRRREAANVRALRSICEAGCRGELPRHTQPSNPFAQLPSWDDPPGEDVQLPDE